VDDNIQMNLRKKLQGLDGIYQTQGSYKMKAVVNGGNLFNS
jgi:hypothetical protein